jgi:hypothetical protein
VISHRDPGVANWLDTEGHRRGLIMLRWQGLSGALADEQQPSARLVAFDSLLTELPADVAAFSPAERYEQLRARRENVQQRFDG